MALSTEHLLREARAVGAPNSEGSSARGFTDGEAAPRKGPAGDAGIKCSGCHGNLTGWPGLKELRAYRIRGTDLDSGRLTFVLGAQA